MCHLAGLLASRADVSLVTLIERDYYLSSLSENVQYSSLGRSRALTALPGLIKFIRAGKFDAVISSSYINLLLGMLRRLIPSNVRIVARETTIPSVGVQRWRFPRLVRLLYRWSYRSFDHIICQSADMSSDLSTFADISSDKISVVFNPHKADDVRVLKDRRWFARDTETKALVLTCVGKFSKQKNFSFVIDALAKGGFDNWVLNIVGDGPLRSELQKQIDQYGLKAKVRMEGVSSEVEAILAHSDCLVMASHFEGMSNVMIESVCVGTPVIALPAPGGIAEVLGAIDGCKITKDRSIQALTHELSIFEKGERLPSESSLVFDPETIADAYLGIASGDPRRPECAA